MQNMTEWVATMSSATLRPFRHTATTVALAIQAALVEVARILDHRITSVEQQVQAGSRAKHKTKVQEMQRALAEANHHRDVCGNDIKEFFDTVFVHRYRDVDPRIRTECVEALGYWIWELPTIFMTPEYLRYLGWMLTDTSHSVRHEVLKQLGRMFKRDASQLGHFIDRFRPRLVEIATKDLDVSVRIVAIAVIETLRENGMLEPDEIDSVGRLVFDSDLRVRKAVVTFFNACVQDLVETKIEEVGGSETVNEAFGDVEDDNYGAPQETWIHIKCLAENLAAYDRQITEESGQPVTPQGLDTGIDLLQVMTPDTRVSLAAQVLYERVAEVKNWEALAGYLLYDHTTSSGSRSRRSRQQSDVAVKEAIAPTEEEERILLEILAAAAKLNLQLWQDHHHIKKKATRGEGADSPEETAVQLAAAIPRLLNKFGAAPDTAKLVLRLEHCLDLEVFQTLRQDSSKYEKLLDEISTQFRRHDDTAVLAEATQAFLHARRYDELEELTDTRIQSLWEIVVELLRNFDRYIELNVRGNLDAEKLAELSVVLVKISKLASISDCVDILEAEGRTGDSTASTISILVEIVQRGKLEQVDEDEIGELENQVTAHAIDCCQFYFMWKVRSIADMIGRGVEVPATLTDSLTLLRQKFWRHLIETFSTRALVDDLCRMATGTFCDFHVLLGGLRPLIERAPPEVREKLNLGRLLPVTQEIEPRLVKELIYVFEGVEKQYAKLSKKTLNEPAEDEDPIDDEDEDEDEEDENLSQEEKLAGQLRAEKNLCELAARLVLTIQSKMVDLSGPSPGRLRKRLLRNSSRLGNNYKEVVAYLDDAKVAELIAGKKRGGQKKAPARAAASKSSSKSAEIVVDDDDEDENHDEENEHEEHEEEEQESEKQDETVADDQDDDILGD
jgi:cohesin complex subunit SA-1/2